MCMRSGIYKITNTINGKFYVGSSKDIDWRWYCHRHYLETGKHNNPKLQHSWNKHGSISFIFEVIEDTISDSKTLLEREQYYLDILTPYKRNIGYNICPKAEGGDNITYHPNRDEFVKKMILINKGENNGMFGKKHSDDAIKQQKEKAKGRYTLDWFIERYGELEGKQKFDDRRLMLKNRKINYSFNNGLTGIKRGPMSENVKRRISERKTKLKLIRNDLHKDILNDLHTVFQLECKYGISKTTILREKRKLINRV